MKIEPDLRLVLNNYLGLVDSAWKPVHNPASPIRYLPSKIIVLLLSEKTKKITAGGPLKLKSPACDEHKRPSTRTQILTVCSRFQDSHVQR